MQGIGHGRLFRQQAKESKRIYWSGMVNVDGVERRLTAFKNGRVLEIKLLDAPKEIKAKPKADSAGLFPELEGKTKCQQILENLGFSNV